MQRTSDAGIWRMVAATTVAAVMLAMGAPQASVQLPPLVPSGLPRQVCAGPLIGTTWSTKALGSTDYDDAADIAVDEARCAVYVGGYTHGTISGVSAGLTDAVVARYDTRGVRTWAVQFGSPGWDSVHGIAVDADGDVYVLGSTDDTLPGSPIINLGASDIFLVKLDSAGAIVWTRMLGSAGDENPTGLAIDSAGEVYITGFTDGVLTGATAGGQDYFLGRYDPDGNLVMLMQRGSAGNDRAKAVAVGPSDNPYIVGDTDGDLEGVQAGNADIFVAKYDPAGTELWIDQRGTSDLDLGADIAVNQYAEVFVAGSTALGMDGNVSAGAMDVVLLRYSASGTWTFTRQRGSTSTDTSESLALTSGGAPIIMGSTSGTLDGLVPVGSTDAFVMKLNRSGIWSWTSQIGSTGYDRGEGVAVGFADQVFATGNFGASLNGVSPIGLRDMFAVSFTSGGVLR